MIVSVFKDLYKSTDVPFHVPLDKIIKRIKAGTSKELVEAVRQGNGNEKKEAPLYFICGNVQRAQLKLAPATFGPYGLGL